MAPDADDKDPSLVYADVVKMDVERKLKQKKDRLPSRAARGVLAREMPTTLEGFAKKAYDFFEKELRPLEFKLHAEIVSFPGGMPGDVGLFLKW